MRAAWLAVLVTACGLATSPLHAQKADTRPHRIGVLLPYPPGAAPHLPAFFAALKELGYVEGDNFVIEKRFANGDDGRLPALAAELVQANVEVIVAAGPSATRAAYEATPRIPIVGATVDPIEQGLIASLAKPGGNLTGWTILSADSAQKQLSLLREMMPRLARVAILANAEMPGHNERMRRIGEAAASMGITPMVAEVASEEAVKRAFAAMVRERVEAFVVLPDPTMDGLRGAIAHYATERRLPGISTFRIYAQAGGLMSYGPSLSEMVRSWAVFVDKILRGARPSELPVETPKKYELVLNLATARTLGITFPPALRIMADDIIQ